MTEQPTTFLERDHWMRAVLKSELPPVAVRVALVIGFHLNVDAGRCYPGIDDIVTASHVPERSLYRQIALLEKAGWISIRRVRKPGRNNEYVLVRPATAMAEETRQNRP
jgi:Helix-turn-helix domain